MRGVRPDSSARFTSAPSFSSSRAMSRYSQLTASHKGVSPLYNNTYRGLVKGTQSNNVHHTRNPQSGHCTDVSLFRKRPFDHSRLYFSTECSINILLYQFMHILHSSNTGSYISLKHPTSWSIKQPTVIKDFHNKLIPFKWTNVIYVLKLSDNVNNYNSGHCCSWHISTVYMDAWSCFLDKLRGRSSEQLCLGVKGKVLWAIVRIRICTT